MNKFANDTTSIQGPTRQPKDIGRHTDSGFYPRLAPGLPIHRASHSPMKTGDASMNLPSGRQTGHSPDYLTLNPCQYVPSSQLVTASPTGPQQQYEMLIEFELRREREKNRLLQQRLRNKEIFIQQMKELHEELTAAFQKCQNELELTRKSLEHTNWQLQQVTSGEAQQEIVREYVEEISQLKHLIIRLEDEINQYERKGLSRQYRSVHLPNCDELSSSRVFSDKRGIIANEAEEKDKDKHKKGRKQEKSKEQKKNSKRELQSSEKEGKRGNKTSHRVTASAKPHLSKQVRSKTLMDKQSPEFKSAGRMQEEVEEQKVRIANFCSRFLTMVECFSAQAVRCQQSNQALTRRMKVAWKWVKGVVAEWHRLDKLAKESGLSRPARQWIRFPAD